MPAVFSISTHHDVVWAASSEGLIRVESGQTNLVPQSVPQPVPQPQQVVMCCLALHDRVLIGGSPHGITFSKDQGATWTAAWLDGIDSLITCMAAQPDNPSVILAGTDEGKILRSTDYGEHWEQVNVGLDDHPVLCLTWMKSSTQWPYWETVFAGTENGLYRSPNGGRAWKRVPSLDHQEGKESAVQCIAVGVDAQILLGMDVSGLWSSINRGHQFTYEDLNFNTINAMTGSEYGIIMSDTQGLHFLPDGHDVHDWQTLNGYPAALALLIQENQLWIGHEDGLLSVPLKQIVKP